MWKMHESKNCSEFQRKSVPRGTILWNGNPQNLVSVDNYFGRTFLFIEENIHKALKFRFCGRFAADNFLISEFWAF
jgi:hypothetical protein